MLADGKTLGMFNLSMYKQLRIYKTHTVYIQYTAAKAKAENITTFVYLRIHMKDTVKSLGSSYVGLYYM